MTIPTPTSATKSGHMPIICLIAAAILVSITATLASHGSGTTILLAPGPTHHTEVFGGPPPARALTLSCSNLRADRRCVLTQRGAMSVHS